MAEVPSLPHSSVEGPSHSAPVSTSLLTLTFVVYIQLKLHWEMFAVQTATVGEMFESVFNTQGQFSSSFVCGF